MAEKIEIATTPTATKTPSTTTSATTSWRRTTWGGCVNARAVLMVTCGVPAPPAPKGQPAPAPGAAGRGTSRRQYGHRMTPAAWSTSIPAPQDGQLEETVADL